MNLQRGGCHEKFWVEIGNRLKTFLIKNAIRRLNWEISGLFAVPKEQRITLELCLPGITNIWLNGGRTPQPFGREAMY